ncbi:MAG TPA: hypothetical protein VHY20_03530 [Pirellulales bacterium]|nr:hypothetical protein [Pirellulales bacterium]
MALPQAGFHPEALDGGIAGGQRGPLAGCELRRLLAKCGEHLVELARLA